MLLMMLLLLLMLLLLRPGPQVFVDPFNGGGWQIGLFETLCKAALTQPTPPLCPDVAFVS